MISPDNPRHVQLKARMGRTLHGFSSGLPEGYNEFSLVRSSPDPKLFPVPELVLFALRNVMGFRWWGQGEKVRWSVPVTVAGEPFLFELRKFGFGIDHGKNSPPELRARVYKQLSSALRLLEPLLAEVAKAQIDLGNLTMANRMSEFDNRYAYFRHIAERSFAPVPQPMLPAESLEERSRLITESMNADLSRQQEGYFASGAMVDAFFSRLEHRVLLLRAFIGRPLSHGEFATFLGKRWDARLNDVGFGALPRAAQLLGQVRNIKDTIRNPIAHGGVENDGGAFYFHMPGVGALPANLSRYRGRMRMSFYPIASSTHEETVRIFDEVDKLLTSGPFELPNEFVRWGIDPQYDAESLQTYQEALGEGPDAVERLIERLGYEWERHVNMDY